MILIAGSGSTKADWCVVEHGRLVQQILTKDTNPFSQSEEEVSSEIVTALILQLKVNKFETVHFYGTGRAFPDGMEMVRRAIAAHLQVNGRIRVSMDMLAAARRPCGHQLGIVCITDTGSNSCYHDDKSIVSNISPLGFIPGDESNGVVLGKLLIDDTLKNRTASGPKEKFLEQYNLTSAEVIDRVCRQPFPNHFLAGFPPFLIEHPDEPTIREPVLNSFKKLLRHNAMQCDYQYTRIHSVSSVAFYYRELLSEACKAMEIHLGMITKSPMRGLIKFYG